MRKKFTMLLAALLACVGVAKAEVTNLPQITTDPENPIYYTIKNVRGNAFARYDGDGEAIKLTPTVESNAYLFYFTEGTTAGTYKIHNSANGLLCAAPNSWTEEGLDWYIAMSGCSSHPGLAISKESTLTAAGSEAWNDYQNSHKSVAWYGGNDAGSTWEIAPYESAAPTIQFSTEDNIVLHYIRSNRRDSYVNFDGHNSTFKEGNLGAGSYWYFVQDTEAQKNAPEGFVACRIFNAAHATGVENYTSGFMGTDQWPARVHYIGFRENDNYGYVIYRADEDGTLGWHDYNGTYIGAYGVGDNGSLWRIYPSGKAAADLIAEAKSVVDNMIGLLPAAKEASYYSYSEQGIAAIEAAIASFDENNLASALTSAMTIGNAQKTGAPAAGDFIILKNKAKNEYMTTMESGDEVHRTSDKNNPKALWQVVAGEDSKVKLYNVASEKYLGALGQSAKVLMVEETDAAQFTFSNVADVYAAFTSGGGSYTYAHMDGWYDRVVGWEAAADASQWIVTNVRPLSVVYKYNDVTLSETTEYVEYGTTYTVSSPYTFTKPSACTKNDVALEAVEGVFSFEVTEATTLTIELLEDLPFETATDANNINVWYHIRMHTNQPGYLGDIADDNTINVALGKSSDIANDNYIWGFVGNVFEGITVVNKGTNLQLTSTGSGDVTLTKEGTPFFVAETSETTLNATNGFCLRRSDSNNYLNANYGAGKLSHWSSTDAGSTMFLVEYEEDIVAVSDVNWATMYLGYAAYIPEGVNVYTATSIENGYVELTQLEGAIPENTGVLLENKGEFTFKKAAKVVAAADGNLLEGSTVKTYIQGPAYVLANGSNGVGLYQAKLNKDASGAEGTTHFLNNANKAYLPAPAGSAAPMFSFTRGEDTTGIENSEITIQNSTVIYDLLGRRVEKMEKGIYIVNGKKVIR